MSNKKLIDKYERKLEQLKTMQSIIEKRTNGVTNFRSDIALIEEFVQDLKGENFNSTALLKQALVSGRSEQLNFKNKPEQDVEEDDLLNDCIEYAKAEGKIRRGTLQRKFKLGYFRAGRIMAQIEAKGILGEMTGRYDNDREVCF